MQFNGFIAERWWDDSPGWNLGLEFVSKELNNRKEGEGT